MVHAAATAPGLGRPWGRFSAPGLWGGGPSLSLGTPGLGLLMIPLEIGVCLLFAGSHRRWARLLVWGSLAALVTGVLNSVRISLMPATLWQLVVYVLMIASDGGLMFRSLDSYDRTAGREDPPDAGGRSGPGEGEEELCRELAALRRRLDSRER